MLVDLGGLLSGALNPGTVTLTNTSIQDTGGGAGQAGIRFNSDGTTDRYRERIDGIGVYTQINASTDWIIPNGDASSLFEVKVEEVSASGTASSPLFGNPGGSGKGTGVWWNLGSNREWYLDHSESDQTYTWVIDAYIRYAGGVPIAIGRYTLQVTEITI